MITIMQMSYSALMSLAIDDNISEKLRQAIIKERQRRMRESPAYNAKQFA